jgi:hypothetical protein
MRPLRPLTRSAMSHRSATPTAPSMMEWDTPDPERSAMVARSPPPTGIPTRTDAAAKREAASRPPFSSSNSSTSWTASVSRWAFVRQGRARRATASAARSADRPFGPRPAPCRRSAPGTTASRRGGRPVPTLLTCQSTHSTPMSVRPLGAMLQRRSTRVGASHVARVAKRKRERRAASWLDCLQVGAISKA